VLVQILRVSGSVEEVELTQANWVKELEPLIDSRCFDTVNLGDGKVMIVDDDGYMREREVNLRATMLYWSVKGLTNWCILGDVAIMNDRDLGD